MINRIILPLLLIFSSISFLNADKIDKLAEYKKLNKMEFKTWYQSYSGSGYYDNNNGLWPDRAISLRDTINNNPYTVTEIYDLISYEINFLLKYNFSKDFSVFLASSYLNQELNFKINFLDSLGRGSNDILTEEYKELRKDKSNSLFKYLRLGGKYKLLNETFLLYLNSGMNIPFYSHNSVFNDPNVEFLSSGAFQFYGGLEIGYKTENNTFLLGSNFNFQAEEHPNQLIHSLKLHLEKIERTKINLKIFYVQPLDINLQNDIGGNLNDINNNYYNFDPYFEALNESFLLGDLGFDFRITPKIDISFSYQVKIFGSNTMDLKSFKLGGSYRFLY